MSLCNIDDVRFDANGLVPTVVCDEDGGRVRMLAYSNAESLRLAIAEGAGIYWSRSRNALWRKGETSGNTQRLARAVMDCDRDALIFYVRQSGPTCHRGSDRCFDEKIFSWETLVARIAKRADTRASNSYTARLIDNPSFLNEKILEEADEVTRAATREEVAWECADLLYFMSVKMQAAGIGITDVMDQLASRAVDA
jgi:phosphoribosyl-ATP pyrophosphohydrolase/phosphoribosyl-AMP cyclohydrolase